MSSNSILVLAIILFYRYSFKLEWFNIKDFMDSLNTLSLIIKDIKYGDF